MNSIERSTFPFYFSFPFHRTLLEVLNLPLAYIFHLFTLLPPHARSCIGNHVWHICRLHWCGHRRHFRKQCSCFRGILSVIYPSKLDAVCVDSIKHHNHNHITHTLIITTHTHTLSLSLIHIHTCIHTHTCMHAHAHTHACTRTYSFTRSHTHTLTHTHTHTLSIALSYSFYCSQKLPTSDAMEAVLVYSWSVFPYFLRSGKYYGTR